MSEPSRPNYERIRQAARSERAKVPQQIDELLKLSPEDQRKRIDRCTVNLRSPEAVDELLRRSREECLRDHRRSHHLAQLALIIAGRISYREDHLGSSRITYDYQALASAQMANASRIASEWDEAYRAMDHAFWVMQQGTGDIHVYARLCALRGSLLKDRRHTSAALADLQVARTLYRQIGDRAELVNVLLNAATVHYQLGELNEARYLNSEAIRLIDEYEDPHLAIIAGCNEALYLTEAGEAKTALKCFRLLPDFAELGVPQDSMLYAYRNWELGRTKLALGYYRGARELLESARSYFEKKKVPFNEALITLDLARLYFEAHKTTRKVYKSATRAIILLRSQDLDPEAWEAVEILARATLRQALDISKIQLCIQVLRGGRVSESVRTC